MSNKGIGVREIPAAVVLNKFVGNEEDSNKLSMNGILHLKAKVMENVMQYH